MIIEIISKNTYNSIVNKTYGLLTIWRMRARNVDNEQRYGPLEGVYVIVKLYYAYK